MNSASNGALFAALRKSCLLTKEQLASAKKVWARSGESATFSRELIRRNWVTAWQLRQLAHGHTQFRFADYTLIDVLGRGNMGIVYKARHHENRTLVALKVLSGREAGGGRRSARFRREIRLAKSVQSPHVVGALDSGRVAGRDFLVMELAQGRTLDCWIQANRQLPIRWVCECARQVAIGLQHVHESGLIHRDIKPSNIMVSGDSFDRRPRVQILDLGLGRVVGQSGNGDDLTRDGHTVGTLDYMAPEQLQNNRLVDIRSDIYALGCTLFETLTGRQPFEGRDIREKLFAKLTTEPAPLETLREDVPADLRGLIVRMMSRAPDERPATPSHVAEALRAFLSRERFKSSLQAEMSHSTVLTRRLAYATSKSNHLKARVCRTVRIVASQFVRLFATVRLARLWCVRASE